MSLHNLVMMYFYGIQKIKFSVGLYFLVFFLVLIVNIDVIIVTGHIYHKELAVLSWLVNL